VFGVCCSEAGHDGNPDTEIPKMSRSMPFTESQAGWPKLDLPPGVA